MAARPSRNSTASILRLRDSVSIASSAAEQRSSSRRGRGGNRVVLSRTDEKQSDHARFRTWARQRSISGLPAARRPRRRVHVRQRAKGGRGDREVSRNRKTFTASCSSDTIHDFSRTVSPGRPRISFGSARFAEVSNRPVPTPVLAFETVRRKAIGALNFTASHNPPIYEGLKFRPETEFPALPEVTSAIEAEIAKAGEVAPAAEAKPESFDPNQPYLENLGPASGRRASPGSPFAWISGSELPPATSTRFRVLRSERRERSTERRSALRGRVAPVLREGARRAVRRRDAQPLAPRARDRRRRGPIRRPRRKRDLSVAEFDSRARRLGPFPPHRVEKGDCPERRDDACSRRDRAKIRGSADRDAGRVQYIGELILEGKILLAAKSPPAFRSKATSPTRTESWRTPSCARRRGSGAPDRGAPGRPREGDRPLRLRPAGPSHHGEGEKETLGLEKLASRQGRRAEGRENGPNRRHEVPLRERVLGAVPRVGHRTGRAVLRRSAESGRSRFADEARMGNVEDEIAMFLIEEVFAREILDSRAIRPSRSKCFSSAERKDDSAFRPGPRPDRGKRSELRDGDRKRIGGKGVLLPSETSTARSPRSSKERTRGTRP